jgi:hypothetical protein
MTDGVNVREREKGVKFVLRRDDNRKRGTMKDQSDTEERGQTDEAGF